MVFIPGNCRKWNNALLISPPAPSSEPPPPYSPPRNISSKNHILNSAITQFPFFPSDLSLTKKARAALNHGPSSAFHPPCKVKALGEPPPYSLTDTREAELLLNKSYDLDVYPYKHGHSAEKKNSKTITPKQPEVAEDTKYLPFNANQTLKSPKNLYEHSLTTNDILTTNVFRTNTSKGHTHPQGPVLRNVKSLQIPGSRGVSHNHPPSTVHLHPFSAVPYKEGSHIASSSVNSTTSTRSHSNFRSPIRSNCVIGQFQSFPLSSTRNTNHNIQAQRSPPAHALHIARPFFVQDVFGVPLSGTPSRHPINQNAQVHSQSSYPSRMPLKSHLLPSMNKCSERTHCRNSSKMDLDGYCLNGSIYLDHCGNNEIRRRNKFPTFPPDQPFSDSEELNHRSSYHRSRWGRHSEQNGRRKSAGVLGRRPSRTMRLEQEAAHSMTAARAFPVHITTPRMRSCRSLDELSDLLQEDLDILDSSLSPVPSVARSLDDLSEPLYMNIPGRCNPSYFHINTSVPDVLEPPPLPAKPNRNRTTSLSPVALRDKMTSLQEQLEKIKQVAVVLGNKVERGEFSTLSTLCTHRYQTTPKSYLKTCGNEHSAFKRIIPSHSNAITPPGVPSRAPVINDVSFLLNKEASEKFNVADPSIVHASYEGNGHNADSLLDIQNHYRSPVVNSLYHSPEDVSLPYSRTPELESSSHESGYSSTDSRSGATQRQKESDPQLLTSNNRQTGVIQEYRNYNASQQNYQHVIRQPTSLISKNMNRYEHNSFSPERSPTYHPESSTRSFPRRSSSPVNPRLSNILTLPQLRGDRSPTVTAEYRRVRSNSGNRGHNGCEAHVPFSFHNKLYGSMDQLKLDLEKSGKINDCALRNDRLPHDVSTSLVYEERESSQSNSAVPKESNDQVRI